MIRQGAQLVENVQQILDELQPTGQHVSTPARSEQPDNPLLDALGHDPVTLDALVARTGWSAAALSIQLLDLELEGSVARLPGQLFQRLVKA